MSAGPLIWALVGARAGDTAQVRALASAVGGTIIEKPLRYTALHLVPNVLRGPGFASLAPEAKALMTPPWPDLVIAVGRRSAPVALSIRAASGGAAKLVQIGRPRLALTHFDLVLTTPQYGLPQDGNVVMLPAPFTTAKTVAPDMLQHWQEAWAKLPRPWIMAAIGAGKYPLRLNADDLTSFASALNAAATKENASILLFDSPRSAPGARDAVAEHLSRPHWTNAGNPPGAYAAALALADYGAVTGDSVSMAADVMAAEKPLALFLLPRQPALRWRADHGVAAALARRGLLSPPRDTAGFMQRLISTGAAGVLGEGWGRAAPLASAQAEAVMRVRRLLASASSRAAP